MPIATPALVTLKVVTHIGTFNAHDKGLRGDSYEGAGLSFSVHPEDWESIAQLGGAPWWEADLSGLKIVDGHAFIQAQGEALKAWGIEHGWVEPVTAFAARWYDDEMEGEMETLLNSREEAEEEIEFNEGTVEEREALTPTKRLTQAMRHSEHTIGKPSASALEDLATVWAEEQGFDGIWWDDDYQPEHYSAPRGVIFASKVDPSLFTCVHTPSAGPRR